jgi:hypothetical protein
MGCLQSREQDAIASGVVCEIWSPYDAFDAAQTMLRVLKQSKPEDVSPRSLE